jgi:futalosine hydrolase
MKILIVAATPFEIAPVQKYLDQKFIKTDPFRYQKGEVQVSILITGVGLTHTAYALGRVLGTDEWNLIINAGIAGAINRALSIGEVVQVTQEQFADQGVEEADGSFTNLHELGLIAPDQPPYKDGVLVNERSATYQFLKGVKGVSVNKVHGSEPSIKALVANFPEAEIESMEGAAFFYACLHHSASFLEIRSISNYVEARNRDNWNLPLAIKNLNDTLIEMIESLFH